MVLRIFLCMSWWTKNTEALNLILPLIVVEGALCKIKCFGYQCHCRITHFLVYLSNITWQILHQNIYFLLLLDKAVTLIVILTFTGVDVQSHIFSYHFHCRNAYKCKSQFLVYILMDKNTKDLNVILTPTGVKETWWKIYVFHANVSGYQNTLLKYSFANIFVTHD